MEREPLIEFQPIAVPGQFWLIQQMQIDDHGAVSPLRFTLQNIPHPQEIYELLRSLALKP